MSLDALRVALQGLVPLTPIAAAVQGLIEELRREKEQQASGYAKSHVNNQPNYDAYVRMMNAQFFHKQRLMRDDQLAVEFITALVQTEILNG